MMRVVAALAVLTGPAWAIDSGDLDCELMSEAGAMSFTFAPVSRAADGRWSSTLVETSMGYKGDRAQIPPEARQESVENSGRRRPMVTNQPWLAHT
jgi:hypothetical protein